MGGYSTPQDLCRACRGGGIEVSRFDKSRSRGLGPAVVTWVLKVRQEELSRAVLLPTDTTPRGTKSHGPRRLSACDQNECFKRMRLCCGWPPCDEDDGALSESGGIQCLLPKHVLKVNRMLSVVEGRADAGNLGRTVKWVVGHRVGV